MAATYTALDGVTNRPQRVGQLLMRFQSVVMDTSYPTGGYAYTAANAGMTKLFGLIFINGSAGDDATHGYSAHYNTTTGKIMLYWTAAAAKGAFAEVDNATDVSAAKFSIIAVGV